ncbi:MAG: pseudouridine synthase [Bowdeniella nasicola]|nr:pseudouridine synthase [Bowdeniella nasicola]
MYQTKPPMRGGLPARPLRLSNASGSAFEQVTAELALLLRQHPRQAAISAHAAFAAGYVVTARDEPVAATDPAGAGLYLHRPVPDEGQWDQPLEVIGQGEGWVAINKPSGLATMPRGGFVARSAVVQARRQWRNDDVVPAHRLDRLTSGILILITDPTARSRIHGWFAHGQVEKTYHARTHLPEASGYEQWFAGMDYSVRLEKRRGDLATRVVAGPPNSHTHMRLLSVRAGQGVWQLRPITGKTHQLRAVLAHAGFPIINDPLYPQTVPVDDTRWTAGLELCATGLHGPECALTACPPWEK